MSTRTTKLLSLDELIIQNVYTTLDRVGKQFFEYAQDTHASVVFNDSFWSDMQSEMIDCVTAQLQKVLESTHTDSIEELVIIRDFSVRTAIEEFKHCVTQNPEEIQCVDAWVKFSLRIREVTTEIVAES